MMDYQIVAPKGPRPPCRKGYKYFYEFEVDYRGLEPTSFRVISKSNLWSFLLQIIETTKLGEPISLENRVFLAAVAKRCPDYEKTTLARAENQVFYQSGDYGETLYCENVPIDLFHLCESCMPSGIMKGKANEIVARFLW